MIKFSIIVPIYNTEKFLRKCLDSIYSQTIDNYEVILINDGSTDNSSNIIKEYKKRYTKNTIVVNQKNSGTSSAKNKGIDFARGEYILFVDSDDYIENDLLNVLDQNLDGNPDIVRFQINDIVDNKCISYNEKPFDILTGEEAFKKIVKYHYVDVVCSYLYKKSFLQEYDLKFKIGLYHEDFGLVPLALIKAEKVKSINYIGYNYVYRNNSIMNSNSYEKEVKKAFDVFTHYLFLKNQSDNKVYRSFIANSVILKLKKLKGKEFKEYMMLIKTNNLYDDLLRDNIKQKIKIILIKFFPKIYINSR